MGSPGRSDLDETRRASRQATANQSNPRAERNPAVRANLSAVLRRGRESNPRIAVLQTATLPLGYPAEIYRSAQNIWTRRTDVNVWLISPERWNSGVMGIE